MVELHFTEGHGAHRITTPEEMEKRGTFTFHIDRREVFRITPDREVIVQGDVWEAAQVFWVAVQELAPKGWKIVKEPQGKGGDIT